MLTLHEVLADTAASPGFEAIGEVDINARGNGGESPLHWMSTLGDSKAVRFLLEAGAAIDATDKHGNTPLHEAVSGRHTQAAQALIEHGASIGIQNSRGQTAKDIAREEGFEPVVLLFQRP